MSARPLLYFLKNTLALGKYVAVLNSQACSLSTDVFTTVLSGNMEKRTGLGDGSGPASDMAEQVMFRRYAQWVGSKETYLGPKKGKRIDKNRMKLVKYSRLIK